MELKVMNTRKTTRKRQHCLRNTSISICFSSLILFGMIACLDFPSNFENKHLDKVYVRGKDEMAKLQRMMETSRLPHEHSCWKSALENLEISCNDLTQDRQSRLAFIFTTCFTQMTGMGAYICDETTDVKDCFRAFDPAVINIYHSYFLHTQDMCFYLQHQVWQEQTEKAVNQLTSAAVDVAKTIENSKDTQSKILESQKESVKVQSNLLKDNNILYRNIIGFKEVFEEFRHSADEHRIIFFEMFEKLTRMQKLVSWIQGEMSLLDMMGFYFFCLIFGFVSTSTQRTHQARFWLVMLFIASIASERYAFQHFAGSERNYSPEEVQSYIWLIRKVTAGVGVFIVLFAAARYRDYHVLNNNMLSELHGRMDLLVQFIQDMSKAGTKIPTQILNLAALGDQKDEEKEALESEDDPLNISTSSDSSFSNYSRDSDPMFEDEPVVENTPLNTDSASVDEVQVQAHVGTNTNKTSFIRRLFSDNSKSSEVEPKPVEPLFYPNDLPPLNPLHDTSGHRYFLRERKSPMIENQIVKTESPTEFARKLKQSRRNSQSKFIAERANAASYFSDDDEL